MFYLESSTPKEVIPVVLVNVCPIRNYQPETKVPSFHAEHATTSKSVKLRPKIGEEYCFWIISTWELGTSAVTEQNRRMPLTKSRLEHLILNKMTVTFMARFVEPSGLVI